MKKKTWLWRGAAALFAVIFMAMPVRAEEYDYGQDELLHALPGEVADELAESGITPDNSGALGLSVGGVLDWLWQLFREEVTAPLRMLAALCGVALLCAVTEALRDSSGSSQAVNAFGIVGVLAGAGMMCAYVTQCVVRTGETLQAGGAFLLTFVPVFAGIMAVTGQLSTATAFNAVVLVASQVFSQLMITVLMPMTSSILGISVAGAVNPDLNIERVAELVKKIIIWAMGLLITVFVGLLSIQSFVTSSADSLTMKATKFAVSSSVPIVGGAVSDALGTVKGSLGLLKSSTGTFGIVAAVALLVPNLLSVLCYKIALAAAAAVSELFGVKPLAALARSGESVMTIIFAMLFSFALLAVVSVALMLFIGTGGNV